MATRARSCRYVLGLIVSAFAPPGDVVAKICKFAAGDVGSLPIVLKPTIIGIHYDRWQGHDVSNSTNSNIAPYTKSDGI